MDANTETTLELRKITELNGSIWYAVYVNDRCETSFYGDLQTAQIYYDVIKKNIEDGLKRHEVVTKEIFPAH